MTNQRERAHRILIVDDDPGLIFMLKIKLDLEGYDVFTANSGLQALERVKEVGLPDLALVDIIMPGMNGREFANELHSFSDVPVIMLTSVGDEDTIVDAINTYADDYITKPFRPREVVARIRRVLLRAETSSYSLGPITWADQRLGIDFANQCIYVEGEQKNLTPTETKLLYVLMHHAGKLLAPNYLQRHLWPHGAVVEETLRVNIYRLRQKIERDPANPEYLITHRGEGYSFSPNFET
ncbi:MAG: response regulator transcription factor [Anaerolineae bacterium]|nr:response regulator transcription factor [Anaerolineae bacterium]